MTEANVRLNQSSLLLGTPFDCRKLYGIQLSRYDRIGSRRCSLPFYPVVQYCASIPGHLYFIHNLADLCSSVEETHKYVQHDIDLHHQQGGYSAASG